MVRITLGSDFLKILIFPKPPRTSIIINQNSKANIIGCRKLLKNKRIAIIAPSVIKIAAVFWVELSGILIVIYLKVRKYLRNEKITLIQSVSYLAVISIVYYKNFYICSPI